MVLKSIKSVIGLVIVLLISFGINLALSTQPVYAAGEDISTSFTDPNFKKAVWEWLGHIGEPEGFTQQDLRDRTATNKKLVICGKNITSLAGLEYFDETDLNYLDCASNQITSLPMLPHGLTKLYCQNNLITTLPVLPDGLLELYAYSNELTILPTLPGELITLDCGFNNLTSLPDLPENLVYLECTDNQLTILPDTLPGNLEYLCVNQNQIIGLPNTLPNKLAELKCSNNNLTSLPDVLPDSLTFLQVVNNRITNLPELPNGLQNLSCAFNQLTSLPDQLPASLTNLYCSYNCLTSLPDKLPTNLTDLICSHNNLTGLPELPSKLNDLSCSDNPLSDLRTLPPDLFILDCRFCHLSDLPVLPSRLECLWCNNNYLNVFNGDLKSRIDATTSLTDKKLTPQYRFVYVGESLTMALDGSKQLSSSDFVKQKSDNGTHWINLTDAIDLKDFDLSSSNKNIAEVDSNGLITAKGPGNCNIYAYFNKDNSEYTRVVIPVKVNPPGPDLKVEITCPEQCAVGSKVDIMVEVSNIGTSTSDKAVVNFYINNQLCLLTKTVPKLKAGGKVKVIKGTITVPKNLPKGVVTLKVEIVTDLDVNENNNTVQKSITIVLPDLTITSVSPKKALVAGKSGTINVGIANLTIASSGKFKVQVYRGNDLLGEKNVSSLKQGSKSLSIKIKVPPDYNSVGDTLTAVIDSLGQITEEDEDNNEGSYPIR